MSENYSYKIKLKALIAIFIMLSIAAYRRSLSTLIDTIKEHQKLKNKVELMSKNTKNVDQLNAEITNLDKMIGKEGVTKEEIQQGIVDFIIKNNNGTTINDMKTTHECTDGSYKIHTYQVDLVGNCNQLMSTVYEFEQKFQLGKIVSTKYYTEKKEEKINMLHLMIIFQNYENNK